ncbi:Fur family transcriptional regulator [Spirochaeta africana]|uniref:Fe2+/Zn2+ uptake regulation protein n=1 Tax=Spirochaeta africana (strain ATCC 700263 / DSM 8902 / Z-7692) TaxID=889378 RepID=H9UH26_SPIAZ|nr:Fur family transcriptional regulator [Spirochaeta africana]AFG36819.1 Fe2+/Zn2+ uptake regulation protein [Spirochaeta africana DSM 8902]
MHRTKSGLPAALKQAGLRMTPQRMAICEALSQRFDHPTAQSLYDQVKQIYPSLSLTTVYQTLDTLLKLGAITSLGSAGDDTIHFEVNTDPHINLACLTCHRICDLESSAIRELEREVQEAIGSKVLSGRVVYYSECLEHSDPRACRWNPAIAGQQAITSSPTEEE